jgi:hypothetical protein
MVLHQGEITSASNEPATTAPCAAGTQLGSTLSLGTLSASQIHGSDGIDLSQSRSALAVRTRSCLKCRPAWVSRADSDHVDLILTRPAICLRSGCKKDVDAGDKRGHDENDVCAPVHQVQFLDFCCCARVRCWPSTSLAAMQKYTRSWGHS